MRRGLSATAGVSRPLGVGKRAACLLGTLLVLATSCAVAEDRSALIDIDVVLGFSDTFRLGRWTPLTVIVGNRGNAFNGELDVDVVGGDQFQGSLFTVSHRRRLELPRDARKQFRFTLLLDGFTHPLIIRVTAGGREVARREVGLRHRFATGRLVVVLSRDADLDYLNDAAGEPLRVLYPHPELLPDRWQGYDGVQAVVVHGVSLEGLSTRQYEALEKWLAAGGTLAVSGGPDHALLRTPRLAGLLPATPAGSVRFADGTAFGASLGVPVHAKRPFDVNRVTRVRGRERYRAGNTPLVIEGRRGRGRVFFLTFDVARYPFDRWPGMEQLWLEGLRLAPVEPRDDHVAPRARADPLLALIKASGAGFPGHGVLAVFLVLYLGILATGYRLQPEGRAARWLAGACTWAAPLAFAPAAYLLFGPLLFPPGGTAVAISTVVPHPAGPYADLDLRLGVFANRRQPLRLDYEGAEPALHPATRLAEEGATSSWVLRSGRRDSVEPDDDAPYVLHLLEGRDVIAFEVGASLAQTESGLRLELHNNSGRRLEQALLLVDGTVYPLGAIAADAVVERSLGAGDEAFSLDRSSWREILQSGGALDTVVAREALVHGALERLETHPEIDVGAARLFGFTRAPIRALGAWQHRALTLVMLPIPVSRLLREVPVHGGPG